MRESAYFTVDLDFWSKKKVDIQMLEQLLKKVPKDDRAAAIEHHSILPHIRRYARTTKRVVNLDYHSDMGGCLDITFESGRTGLRRLELHSGSWVDYGELDNKEEYIWRYPDPGCLVNGRTDHFSLDRPFTQIRQVSRNPWRKIRHGLAKPPTYGLSGLDIDGISIVLSPDCCGDDAFEVFKDLVRSYDLELLDILPEDVNVRRLRSLRERLLAEGQWHLDDPFATGFHCEVPRGVLRLWGYRCKTTREWQKASDSFQRKIKIMNAKMEARIKPTAPGNGAAL